MKNRAIYIMILTMIVIMVAVSVAGCFNNEEKFQLVPTSETITEETITEATTTKTSETTVETTIETETIETTVETSETTIETEPTETTKAPTPTKKKATPTPKPNYKNKDIDFGNDKGAAETHKNHNGGTVKPTKAPTKKPEPTNTPKPTSTPKPTATPKPSKGYAIIKFKVTSHVYVDDESDDTEKKVDYFEFKCVTSKWHSKTLSDYKLVNSSAIKDAMNKKYGDRLVNYSAKHVELVKFLDN